MRDALQALSEVTIITVGLNAPWFIFLVIVVALKHWLG